jgi:hypothetical protein
MIGLSRTWTVLAATGAAAATAVAVAVAVPVSSSAPAASITPPNVRGTTIYACVTDHHKYTQVSIGTLPRCRSGATVVWWTGQAGARSSPTPAPTTAPPTSAPSSRSPRSPSPPPAPTTITWAFCSSDTNGFEQFGPLALFADEWNSTLPQTVCGNSGSDWQVTSTQPAGQTGIATYPDVQLDYNKHQPPVSGLDSSAKSSFAEKMNANSGTSAEAAYDIWLDVGQSSRAEVMIWYDTFNRGTVGGATKIAGPVTFCGQSWQLWQDGPELIWYLPQNEQAGTVCPVQMLQWLQSNGHLSTGASLSQFENGWEIASTGGVNETFKMTNYSVSGLPAGN